jgi:hypothetical protein
MVAVVEALVVGQLLSRSFAYLGNFPSRPAAPGFIRWASVELVPMLCERQRTNPGADAEGGQGSIRNLIMSVSMMRMCNYARPGTTDQDQDLRWSGRGGWV